MKRYTMPLGRTAGYVHAHPERTASKSLTGPFGEIAFQVWSNREAMARSIRMQQRGAPSAGDWRPLAPLTDREGY